MRALNSETHSRKTSIYLKDYVKNKIHLLIPRGKQTEFINDTLRVTLENMERERNKQKFLTLIKKIKPVKRKETARQTLEKIRKTRSSQLKHNLKSTKTK